MRFILLLLPVWLLSTAYSPETFRDKQLNYTRVREAYSEKEKAVVKNLADHSIVREKLRIYLRVFKREKIIELWAKNCTDSAYIPIRKLAICDMSGEVGPKRRYRDLQVPEGFYRISKLNPYSKYYLSLQINYPNASDSIRGVHGRLGNYIFIHGSCISSGCMAITNDRIKELYVYCTEAFNSGQEEIGITIYPAELDDKNYPALTTRYAKYKDELSLWADLKKHYDLFSASRVPPAIRFRADGTHEVK